jgi:hypothetical protein
VVRKDRVAIVDRENVKELVPSTTTAKVPVFTADETYGGCAILVGTAPDGPVASASIVSAETMLAVRMKRKKKNMIGSEALAVSGKDEGV